mmetsp:Transcript_21037/g.40284  ORF Transcript_21037/g.40284 Transcript_21037/m.40284 type:complete len:263 (-) Transcript_21037:19-807(-)
MPEVLELIARVPKSAAQLSIAAALVAAASATLGFLAGLRSRREWTDRPPRGRRRDGRSLVDRLGWHDELCECGIVLSRACSPEEVERHKSSARHKKNLMALDGASEVVVCEEVGEYRAAAQTLVRPDDDILEVGSHVGATTKVLAGLKPRRLIGLDRQADLVAQARKNLPDIRFEICDAFDAQRVMALASEGESKRFTKIFVDISGSRDIATVVRLLDFYENTLRPEYLIVKSHALKRLLLRGRLWVDHPLNADICRWRPRS